MSKSTKIKVRLLAREFTSLKSAILQISTEKFKIDESMLFVDNIVEIDKLEKAINSVVVKETEKKAQELVQKFAQEKKIADNNQIIESELFNYYKSDKEKSELLEEYNKQLKAKTEKLAEEVTLDLNTFSKAKLEGQKIPIGNLFFLRHILS